MLSPVGVIALEQALGSLQKRPNRVDPQHQPPAESGHFLKESNARKPRGQRDYSPQF